MDGLFVGLVVRALLRQQFTRQHYVLQGGVLREKVEVLEYQTKVQPLFADLALALGGGVGSVPHGLAVHLDDAGVRPFQKFRQRSRVVLPEPDEPMIRQRFALFQRE